jgi:hypothetical protein
MAEENAYEKAREERIARNLRMMMALGLFDEDVALASQLRKTRGGAGGAAAGGGGKRKAAREAPSEPVRRSRRLCEEVRAAEASTLTDSWCAPGTRGGGGGG